MARYLLPPLVMAVGLLGAPRMAVAQAADVGSSSWSAAKTAKYLDDRAQWWLGWSGSARGQGTSCLSCHTAMPFALARPALAEKLGETAPGMAELKLIDNLQTRVDNWDRIVAHPTTEDKDPFQPFYQKERRLPSLGTESVLNALVLVNYDMRAGRGALTEPTERALEHLWQQQQPNGAWLWLDFGLNPWEKNGGYYGASLAAVAVGTAGQNYYEQADIQPKVAALKKYLTTQAAGESLHHRAFGLWASSRLPGILSGPEKKKLIDQLLSLQESDGGWSLPKLGQTESGAGAWKAQSSFPEGLSSDGYATGLVVLALKRAGVAAGDPKLQKGIRWLAANEKEGTWPAVYLNKRRDPQTDVGKFMRDAATSFAVLALTEP